MKYIASICHPTPCFTLVQGISSWLLESFKGSYPAEADTLLSKGAGARRPDFISWFKNKVLSNLAST